MIIEKFHGATEASTPDQDWNNDICAVTTRAQEKKMQEITNLKVAETTEFVILDKDKLIELQKADSSLEKLLNQKESKNKKGEIVKFERKRDSLY